MVVVDDLSAVPPSDGVSILEFAFFDGVIRVERFNVVCLVSGQTRGTYSRTTAVASLRCIANCSEGLPLEQVQTVYFTLQCYDGTWFSATEGSPPSAGEELFDVSADTFCGNCMESLTGPNVTQCVGKNMTFAVQINHLKATINCGYKF